MQQETSAEVKEPTEETKPEAKVQENIAQEGIEVSKVVPESQPEQGNNAAAVMSPSSGPTSAEDKGSTPNSAGNRPSLSTFDQL